MPITLGALHVTGHRGTWLTTHQDNAVVKTFSGQPKDDQASFYEANPTQKPRPRQSGILPSLTIKPTTDFTRLTDAASLVQALRQRSKAVDTPDQVVYAVQAFLRTALEARDRVPPAQQRPLLVLVGDTHTSNVSLMMRLAVIAEFSNKGATLLLELPRQGVDLVKREAQAAADRYTRAPRSQDNRFKVALGPGIDGVTHTRHRFALTNLVAAHSGVDVGHFDTVHEGDGIPGSPDEHHREQSMIQDIKLAREHGNGPVIVATGCFHLPKLHDELSKGFDVVALSHVNPAVTLPISSQGRKRASYLLANDQVCKLQAGPTLERQLFDASGFAARLGVDLRQSLPANAIQMGCPWER
jgi:hypothetical protein